MTPRAARLLDALAAHRAAFAARLDALPEAVVHAAPAPGAWSLAQLAEHLVRIDAGLEVAGPPASAAVRATSGARSRALAGVLSLPVRIPAPPSAAGVMPSADPRWPEVRAQWGKVRAGWRAAPAAGDAVAYRHPLAGPFLFEDALRFLLAHHRHHDAQVERTLAGVRQVQRVEPVPQVRSAEPARPA